MEAYCPEEGSYTEILANKVCYSILGAFPSTYNFHSNNSIYNQTLNVSKFWSILSEEDRDFIQAVQDSIDEGWVWTRK